MQDENINSNNNPSQSSLAYLLHHTNYMHTYIRRLRTPYSGDPHRLKTPLADCSLYCPIRHRFPHPLSSSHTKKNHVLWLEQVDPQRP